MEVLKLKRFNINDYIYIQITEAGWAHLKETAGDDYIKHCIKTHPYEMIIEGEVWYKLQCHQVFSLLPIKHWGELLFSTNIMIDKGDLINYHKWYDRREEG